MSLILAALLLLQDKDGAALVKKAVEATKSQKSFETTFKAHYVPPAGAPLDYEGRQVWVASGILYMGVSGSGGLEKKFVRVGDAVWSYFSREGLWLDAAESGDDAAARGIQHPVEILEILGRNAGAAVKKKPDAAMIALSGNDLKAALRGHVPADSIIWKDSTAQVDLAVDGDGRLKSLSCDASLVSNNPNLKGKIRYSTDVSIVGFNAATELKFSDEKSRPIDLTPKIKELIAGLLGE